MSKPRTKPAPKAAAGEPAVRVIARNKRVGHDFEILDAKECGIVLTGTEVKSLRSGRCSLAEAFGLFRGEELWLLGADIPEYTHGNVHNHVPKRDRKLLLKRRELLAWKKLVREKGITIKALEIRFVGALVKVEVALVRGKKLYDKRQAERERSDRRDIRREVERRRR